MELESRLQGRKIGAEAAFSCPTGFNLVGKAKLRCLTNGKANLLLEVVVAQVAEQWHSVWASRV